MVLPSPALDLDPTDFASAGVTYVLTGRFSGAELTGLDWVKERGKAPPSFPKASADNPAVQEYWVHPGLVFVVESWCFEENALAQDNSWLQEKGAAACGN
jgi:hypothetical protein